MNEYLISGDANPFIPKFCKIESHKKMGDLTLTRQGDNLFLNQKKIGIYLSKEQLLPDHGDYFPITGTRLRKELENKDVLNANVLDFLLTHPKLIPESWKTNDKGRCRCIFFWGTTYIDASTPRNSLFVQCLSWYKGKCGRGMSWVSDNERWDYAFPAAILEN